MILFYVLYFMSQQNFNIKSNLIKYLIKLKIELYFK